MHIGPAIRTASIVMKTELNIKGKKPKFPLPGSQAEEKKMFLSGSCVKRTEDFALRLIHIIIGVMITREIAIIIITVL